MIKGACCCRLLPFAAACCLLPGAAWRTQFDHRCFLALTTDALSALLHMTRSTSPRDVDVCSACAPWDASLHRVYRGHAHAGIASGARSRGRHLRQAPGDTAIGDELRVVLTSLYSSISSTPLDQFACVVEPRFPKRPCGSLGSLSSASSAPHLHTIRHKAPPAARRTAHAMSAALACSAALLSVRALPGVSAASGLEIVGPGTAYIAGDNSVFLYEVSPRMLAGA